MPGGSRSVALQEPPTAPLWQPRDEPRGWRYTVPLLIVLFVAVSPGLAGLLFTTMVLLAGGIGMGPAIVATLAFAGVVLACLWRWFA